MEIESHDQYIKDEEKDINLLLSRIRKDPSNFRDRILDKLEQFQWLQNEVSENPSLRNSDFEKSLIFLSSIYEYFP